MTASDVPPILQPRDLLARYGEELNLQDGKGRVVVTPGVIGTVFFERGSKAEVRQGILACFDRFEAMFGQHLRGGKATDEGKFSKKTAAGVQVIREAIVNTAPYLKVSAVRSGATDQDAAAAYQIETLTWPESPEDYRSPAGWFAPKGSDGGGISYLKFQLPLELLVAQDGLAQYQEMLRFACRSLPVRGGYGGLSSLLPYSFHRFMPQEYALAMRFSGLEIDTYPHTEKNKYGGASYEGEPGGKITAFYGYLKSGAKVACWGHIKSVNWYTLLDEVFVQRLGGEAALRTALDRQDIGIERIGSCVLVRAGEFPRLGAPEEGLPEPYVFVNRVLRVLRNPKPDSLHSYMPGVDHADLTATARWQARFDLSDAPPLPPVPEIVPEPSVLQETPARLAAYAGELCPQTGAWEAPRLGNRVEQLERGQPMPGPKSTETGAVVWYLITS